MEELNRSKGERWSLLAKYLAEDADEQEKAEVENWSGASPENHALLLSCREVMEHSRTYFRLKKFDPRAAWQQMLPALKTEVPSEASRGRIFFMTAGLWRAAASLLLIVMLGSLGYFIASREKNEAAGKEVIAASNRDRERILLPDGSVVTLNSRSSIAYPIRFADNLRSVRVEGEAFFEVKPDVSKPFVLSAGNARIKVLGTSFNVVARTGDPYVEVVVATGKVEVGCGQKTPGPVNPVFLDPGEKATLYTSGNQLVKQVNTHPNVMAWKTRVLDFSETRLQDVVTDLEAVYQCEIRLSGSSLNDLTYTAHFDNQSIGFILEVIRLTFNLELSGDQDHFELSAAAKNH